MTTYENDGFRVCEIDGWYYPERYDAEYEGFVPFMEGEFEVRFSQEAMAIDFLMSK